MLVESDGSGRCNWTHARCSAGSWHRLKPNSRGVPSDTEAMGDARGAHLARRFRPQFRDKNRRGIGESQSAWTDSKMETARSQPRIHLLAICVVAQRL